MQRVQCLIKHNTGGAQQTQNKAGPPKGYKEGEGSKVEDETISGFRKGGEEVDLAQVNKRFVMVEEEVEEEGL